jgi:pre-mRNA-splicing factor ATP-dependent RNA helicase DHX15/PRP43
MNRILNADLAQLDSLQNPLTRASFSSNYWDLFVERKKLPVWQHKKHFVDLLDKFQFILVEAETGSGKTTQIPQWL